MADIAAEVLACLESGDQTQPFSVRPEGLTMQAAYAATARLCALREAGGARRIGRKIGFTNPRLWEDFRIDAPIWGDMFDNTVSGDNGPWRTGIAGIAEPKIEPEIAFGLSQAPAPGMDAAELMDCIGWVAHGFEIVRSIFPGWKFQAADAVASGGMHAAYYLGPRRTVNAENRAAWQQAVGSFSLEILRDGEVMGAGQATDVLGGPLNALAHLVELLGKDVSNSPLQTGEVVTTGSITLAYDIASGQVWETRLEGIDLPGLRLEVA